jgi:hypothetical protein
MAHRKGINGPSEEGVLEGASWWKAPSQGERLSDDNFTVEEGAALLHAIFPNYPDIQGMKTAPDVRAFLRTLRAGEPWRTDAERSTTNEMVCQ